MSDSSKKIYSTRGMHTSGEEASPEGRVLGIEETSWKFKSEEGRIAFEEWRNQLLNEVESESTYLDKLRFLNKWDEFELDELGDPYITEFDPVLDRVLSETIDVSASQRGEVISILRNPKILV